MSGPVPADQKLGQRPDVVTGPRARHVVLHYSQDVKTLHVLHVDMDVTVETFGDPNNGSYEWLIREHGVVTKHSDCGYGQDALALRDGLNEWFNNV
jgi:hypothetical protein